MYRTPPATEAVGNYVTPCTIPVNAFTAQLESKTKQTKHAPNDYRPKSPPPNRPVDLAGTTVQKYPGEPPTYNISFRRNEDAECARPTY